MASRTLNIDERELPANPHLAAKALHAAVLELCMRAGVSRVDLTQHYNDHCIPQGDLSGSIEQCLALLSLFHARRIEASS
jgi:hypothetical protein